jgi:hypothetical protein
MGSAVAVSGQDHYGAQRYLQNRRVWEHATEPPRTPPPDEDGNDARTGPRKQPENDEHRAQGRGECLLKDDDGRPDGRRNGAQALEDWGKRERERER